MFSLLKSSSQLYILDASTCQRVVHDRWLENSEIRCLLILILDTGTNELLYWMILDDTGWYWMILDDTVICSYLFNIVQPLFRTFNRPRATTPAPIWRISAVDWTSSNQHSMTPAKIRQRGGHVQLFYSNCKILEQTDIIWSLININQY